MSYGGHGRIMGLLRACRATEDRVVGFIALMIRLLFCALYNIAGSSNGRTPPFEGGYVGPTPTPAAKK